MSSCLVDFPTIQFDPVTGTPLKKKKVSTTHVKPIANARTTSSISPKSSRVQKKARLYASKNFARSGYRYTKEEDRKLVSCLAEGKSFENISSLLERTTKSIECRLTNLMTKWKEEENLSMDEIHVKTGIPLVLLKSIDLESNAGVNEGAGVDPALFNDNVLTGSVHHILSDLTHRVELLEKTMSKYEQNTSKTPVVTSNHAASTTTEDICFW